MNRRPGERVRHGRRTPDFRAVQDSEAKKVKLGRNGEFWFFLFPLLKPSEGRSRSPGPKGRGCFFDPPYSSRGRRESEAQARSGGARVKRIKTKVQWTFVPLNGLATDGEPRTCKREHGERSAASPRSPAQGPVPWANLLSRPPSEGTLVFGAQSPGCLCLRFLALGKQRKELVVRGRNPVGE